MIDYQKAFYNLCNLASVEYEKITVQMEMGKGCRCGCCADYVASLADGKEIARGDDIDKLAEQLSKIEIDW